MTWNSRICTALTSPVFLISMLSTLGVTTTTEVHCPKDLTQVKDLCYKLYNENLTWFDANQTCLDKNGFLSETEIIRETQNNKFPKGDLNDGGSFWFNFVQNNETTSLFSDAEMEGIRTLAKAMKRFGATPCPAWLIEGNKWKHTVYQCGRERAYACSFRNPKKTTHNFILRGVKKIHSELNPKLRATPMKKLRAPSVSDCFRLCIDQQPCELINYFSGGDCHLHVSLDVAKRQGAENVVGWSVWKLETKS